MTIRTLLIANRGEIARRIIRTARRMGIRTVAVHSTADAEMPFVREADVAMEIGPAAAAESYLRTDAVLEAARRSGADAVHPGYGFLSENATFAEGVEAAGLVWVGAQPQAIRAMGRKDEAKRLMVAAGVPVTPGYHGEEQDADFLAAKASEIGFPVLIKAVAGGGGKGMRRVERPADFSDALSSCRREAKAAFGDDRVLIERYIAAPRHIEIQVFGDRHGNLVHLFERDCSIQRRHQKVIEEAPAPGMNPAARAAIATMALKAARAVEYVGAGTVEFIADGSATLSAERVWFMEMNTRLQVEHPVTEAITGLDLVEWQLRIAQGERLPKRQEDIAMTGAAMEARLYAENPSSGFLPSIGRLARLRMPDGLRVDAGVEEGSEITPFYDPMIAKLIVHAPDRERAAAALSRACAAVEVWPVKTNAGFLARLARDAEFVAGRIDTGFIDRKGATLLGDEAPPEAVLSAAALALVPPGRDDPWTSLPGFRVVAAPERRVAVEIAGATHLVAIPAAPNGVRTVTVGGERVAFHEGDAWPFGPPTAAHAEAGLGAGDDKVIAPMPGRIIAVAVKPGDVVAKGARLLVLEAMKMEHAILAPIDGVVERLTVALGDQVSEGTLLAQLATAQP